MGSIKIKWSAAMQVVEVPDGLPGEGLYHLRWDRTEISTVCRLPIGNATLIPLDCWGAADSQWCPACERRAGRPRPLVSARRAPADEFATGVPK